MSAFKKSACARSRARVVTFFFLLVASALASASTFRLESMTIILDERDGRSSFNVTNSGEDPILLLTKLEDLNGEKFAENILVTPVITRIDPGQSQLVNFELKRGVPLDRERMLKASFEGVAQRVTNGTSMPIRQEIGFIVQPKSIPPIASPWEELKIKLDANTIEISNPGRRVVRLGPSLTLQPSGSVVALEHAYIMPGERVTRPIDSGMGITGISITPLSRFGFAKEPVPIILTP